jgi:RimJ/RimL family protein N-acetyltransferase
VEKPEIVVRKLVPGEEAAYRVFRIHALTRNPAAFTTTAAEAASVTLSWYACRIATSGDSRHFLIGAFDGPSLIGTVGLSGEARAAERHKATLYGMAVHDDFASRGIGGRLLRTLIDEARTIPGLRQINLSMSKGNAMAERLYRACGFEAYGCEPRATFIDGAFHDKLLMVLRLD